MAFAGVLAEYERANVIGTRDLDRILLDHVLDSLSCLLFHPAREAKRFADVGSGGGLPGIPLRLALSEAGVSLFEATSKKAEFLRYAARRLQLDGVEVVNARVEEAGHEARYRSSYQVCTARAVARVSVVAEYCLPLVEVGGYVVSFKGKPEAEELAEGERAAAALGARVYEVIQVPVLAEIGDRERRLVVLKKERETPAKYPRRTGAPAKSPLGRE